MTVVLAGIGADSTNLGALGPLYDDGQFEYVPIPEKTRETTESETLGSWKFRNDDRTAADLTTRIKPQPIQEDERVVTGDDLESWPLHRDPNFETLTYGEHRTSGYVSRLRALGPGDVVGFYAGLRRPEGDRAHRYLIGYFTVDAVDVVTPETPPDERAAILETHSDNAHAKRVRDGDLYLEKTVVIVAGREPGGLFDRHPIRLSEYYVKPGNERPQYYLRDEIGDGWNVTAGGENMMFKPAYRCELSSDEFVDRVGVPGDRLGELLESVSADE
ncbi:Nmad3 family putative nucleotide modification protein [Natronobacterium gregoryi]|uniref:Nucleotide modification associated domain-containing protein n=2 Tax=Natronobacterium gregoryi TaxID=44930 RepID=L0AEF3_NATGS|nr:hypothetical protein [Natronobacterium gregoryi]AFZ71440.1 hypothetical protein Natgr_0177 [Natronobacterium gregoryi SP2]ELY66742.1 hypothetical protein C490_12035 [Natronobacterium gregoryi SP2]PLK19966.1 hypothetical protein CYV19_12210 [Natronobacterium gregoryi SP2]SFJ35901.1 hypothetical protein SAMN05443661_1249 [Natronobacterium gregoryi]